MICDPDSGNLIDLADKIMDSVNDKDRYSYELLLSEIEINTPICHSANDAIKHLATQRNELKKIGKQ